MKPLDLNLQELDVLEQVLKRSLADLDHEIDHTDHAEFRRMLRERHDVLDGVLRKIPERVQQAA